MGDVLIVADDVRFAEEAAAIRALGGLVVRIERPGAGLDGAAAAHPSEAGGVGPVDVVIVNDGDLPRLFDLVDAIAADVMD